MCHEFEADEHFVEWLIAIDHAIGMQVAAGGCQRCGGARLHRADYPRKPRGALIAGLAERIVQRLSFCCARCRGRATPPSVLFLGRKVYVGVTILVACSAMLIRAIAGRVRGVPARTVRRWLDWFQLDLVRTPFFEAARGRFGEPLVEARLPSSLFERFVDASDDRRRLERTLLFLAPITTSTVADGTRFVSEALRWITIREGG